MLNQSWSSNDTNQELIILGSMISSCTNSIIFVPFSLYMRFPTIWYVRPAKAQISLLLRAVWSEPLLVAWIFYECKAAGWTSFGVSKLKRKLPRLVCVYICQNATLLEITCHGSFVHFSLYHHLFIIFTVLFLSLFHFLLLGLPLGHSQGGLLLRWRVINLRNLWTTWELLLYCGWRLWTVVVLWILVTIANVYILKFPEITRVFFYKCMSD